MLYTYEKRGNLLTVSLTNSSDEIDAKVCKKLLDHGELDSETQAQLLKMALTELSHTATPKEYKKLKKSLADRDRKIQALENQLNKLKGVKLGEKVRKRGDSIRQKQREDALIEEEILAGQEDYEDEVAEFAASLEKLA